MSTGDVAVFWVHLDKDFKYGDPSSHLSSVLITTPITCTAFDSLEQDSTFIIPSGLHNQPAKRAEWRVGPVLQMRKQRLRMVKQQAPNHQKFWDETEVRPGAFYSLCTCPLQAQGEQRWLVTPERETGG